MSNIPLEYLMVNSQDLNSDVSSNLETSRDSPDSKLFDEVMLNTGRDTIPEKNISEEESAENSDFVQLQPRRGNLITPLKKDNAEENLDALLGEL
jgi:hypothetical protein